ncbi:MAG: phage integrase SAM-like domain and Arm DNA-binding domain-containing protein [Bacteroidota bacterium]
MVTYKIVLDQRRAKQDQTFPLVVRVTHNRIVCAFQTGVYLRCDQWDKQSLQVKREVENSLALTTKLSNFYLLIQKSILEIERQGDFTFEGLKALLYPESTPKIKETTFKSYCDTIIDDMKKAKRTGGALVYQTAVSRLLDYTKNSELLFGQIDYSLLDSFKTKLIEDGLKPNSIGNYFRSIRALYNKAIKSKVVSRDLYPFHEIPGGFAQTDHLIPI